MTFIKTVNAKEITIELMLVLSDRVYLKHFYCNL